MYDFDEIMNTDPEIADAIKAEMERQNSHIELIASENWVSKAVMAAMGSPLTNKYAEGYPGKRYYGGCQCVDVVEDLARERAKKLFGCEYVNVQPHSGAQANMAVMFAMLEPGDKIMGMNLDHGGHLTHGSPVNMSGKYFDVAHYGVNADGVIDYDEVLRIAKEHKPKLIVAGASAYPRKYSRIPSWAYWRSSALPSLLKIPIRRSVNPHVPPMITACARIVTKIPDFKSVFTDLVFPLP